MIIVQLKGGLGNQLFQYAAGLSLALHHQVPLKVDVTELKRPDDSIGTFRNFDLLNLAKPPVIANPEEVAQFKKWNFVSRYLEKLLPPYKRKIYRESSFTFDNHFFEARSHLYLKGYRQSEKYFRAFLPIVQQHITLHPNVTERFRSYAETLKNTNSVSIHIRRGDYSKKMVQDYHGVLDKEYYQKAIYEITGLVKEISFFIFTDNVEWVKTNLHIENATIVSESVTNNHLEDFYLMSQCSHNIIANSSFSWWAAYLNNNPHKIIIAPKKWFNIADISTEDLYPENWNII